MVALILVVTSGVHSLRSVLFTQLKAPLGLSVVSSSISLILLKHCSCSRIIILWAERSRRLPGPGSGELRGCYHVLLANGRCRERALCVVEMEQIVLSVLLVRTFQLQIFLQMPQNLNFKVPHHCLTCRKALLLNGFLHVQKTDEPALDISSSTIIVL